MQLGEITKNIDTAYKEIKEISGKAKKEKRVNKVIGFWQLLLCIIISIDIWAWGLYFTGVEEVWPKITKLCNFTLLTLFICICILVYKVTRKKNIQIKFPTPAFDFSRFSLNNVEEANDVEDYLESIEGIIKRKR